MWERKSQKKKSQQIKVESQIYIHEIEVKLINKLIFKQESNKCLGQALVDNAAELVKKVSLQSTAWLKLIMPQHLPLLPIAYFWLATEGCLQKD